MTIAYVSSIVTQYLITMNVFVARFDVVNNKNAKFEEDKNSNLPFIGTLLGGKAHSLIINGSHWVVGAIATGAEE